MLKITENLISSKSQRYLPTYQKWKSCLKLLSCYCSDTEDMQRTELLSWVQHLIVIMDKTRHNYPATHFHGSPAEFLKWPFTVQREFVIHCCITVYVDMSWNCNWTGCHPFLSSRQSFQQHYASSHQRRSFLKRASLVWLANHSLFTTQDDWLHSSGIEFSQPGMKLSVFDRCIWGRLVCSKWAFVNLCC